MHVEFVLFSDYTTIFATHDQYATGSTDSSFYNTKEAASMPPNIATSTVTLSSVEAKSPNRNNNITATSIEPESSGSDNNNAIPLLAGVIVAGIIVLFGSVIVLVVIFLLMKARYSFN